MFICALPICTGAHARDQVVEVLVAEHGDLRVEQRHVDELALAGLLGVAQRRLDGDDRIEAGEDVGDGDARLLRLAAGLAGDRHHAGHALDDEVVAGARRVGPVLAEAGDRAVDEARVEARQAVIVEAVFLQPAELEVLDQHVGARRQACARLSAPSGVEKSIATERLPRLQAW